MHFSWKMGSKMEPKSIPKSFNNDFGRPKGRPGPIVNVFGSEKDRKRVLQKSMKKMMRNLEASEYQKIPESIAPWSPKGRFWSRRGGKEGTSPSGTGDFGFDSVIQFKTPCTWRGAADTFWWKVVPRAPKVRCRFGGIENRAKSSLGAPGSPPQKRKYDFRRIQGSKNQWPQAGGQLSRNTRKKQ